MLELIITNRYRLIQKLNIGAFYDVFRAIHIHNETTVAIKIEPKSLGQSKLFNEAKILKELQGESLISDLGFPALVETGSEGTYNYLVMDLFGTSVDKMIADNGGKLQLKFVLELGEQMIEGVQMLHEKGYVHRDLRPEHFLYGRVKRPKKLFITGFCMAKKYLRADSKHADYKDTKQSFTGIPRYLSVNAHMGIQQSRRDDIESLVYILIYLIRGNLPWQKQKAKGRRDKFQKILDVKLTTSIETVCQNVPEVFKELLLYARLLQYEEMPNYQYLKNVLRGISDQNFVY